MPLIARLSNLSLSSGVVAASSSSSSLSSRDEVILQPAPRGRRPQRRLDSARSSLTYASSADSSICAHLEARPPYPDFEQLPQAPFQHVGVPAFPESPVTSQDRPSPATSYGRSCDATCTYGHVEPGTPVMVDDTAFLVVDIASFYGRLPPAYGPTSDDSLESAPPLYDSFESLAHSRHGCQASSTASSPTTPTFPTTPRDLAPPSLPSAVRGKPSSDSLASAWRAIGIDVNNPAHGPRPHCKPTQLLDAFDDFFGSSSSSSSRTSLPSGSSTRTRKTSASSSTLVANTNGKLGLLGRASPKKGGEKEDKRRRASSADLLQSFTKSDATSQGKSEEQEGEDVEQAKKGGRYARAVRRLKLSGWTS